MPSPLRTRLRPPAAVVALLAASAAFPAVASAELKIRMNAQSGPAVVFAVGDGAGDAALIQRRDYDDGGDGAGPLGDPAAFNGRDIVEFTPKPGGAVLTQDGAHNLLTSDWCTNVTDRVICGITNGAELTTTGTDLGDGADDLELVPAVGGPEIDLIANGGAGADFLVGGSGDDVLDGGPGVDNIFANAGADTVTTADNAADGTISCGADNDVLNDDTVDTNQGDCETVNHASNPVTLQFAFASTAVTEGGGQVIAVNEFAPSTGLGSFRIDVVGGTATKGVDYSGDFDGQVITYDNASTSYAFTLATLQDADHEGDETIELRLTSPTGDVLLGSPDTFTLTINDDDPAPGAGGGPAPAPGPSGPVIGALPDAPPVIPAVPTIEKRLPDFTRGGQFLIPACKKRGYCDANDVRTWFQLEGTAPAITIKTTSSTNDAPDPKKVVAGEVVASTPRDGDRVALPVGGTFPVELQVFDPKVPRREQRCKSSQKISAGADTTLGRYLVGKTLDELKKTLLTFDCYSRAGQNEKNVEYAITTRTSAGTRYAEVEKVSDKRIDGSDRTTLVVAMRVPPSELVLTVGADPERPGVGMALSDGTLSVDPDTNTSLLVRVGLPGSAAPAPVGTEVTLRDPDGQLVDRGLTDANGQARLSGRIPEPKRYEIYASFADADGDALAGSIQLDAKRRSSRVETTNGTTVKAGAGGPSTKATPGTSAPGTKAQSTQFCQQLPALLSDRETAELQKKAHALHCSLQDRAQAYIALFGLESARRIVEANQKLTNMALGEWSRVNQLGLQVAWIASGNPSGKLSITTQPKAQSVPVIATDGQNALRLQATATSITDGLLAFRDTENGVTLVTDGRVIIDGTSSEISSLRQVVDRPALVAGLRPNFSILPTLAAFPNAAGIVASGGGNIVASGGGNIVASGGGNIVASGGGNIVASGGGNVVAAGGGNIVASGGGNLINGATGNIVASGGGNIVAAGGGNIIAAGGGNIVASGGGNLTAPLLGNALRASVSGGNIVAGGAGN